MKNTPLRSTLLASNTATRLREMLGIPTRGRPRKARPAVREQMVIEAIEPRVLLSAEALIVPPPPPAEAQVVADAAELAKASGQQALLLAAGTGSPAIDLSSMVAAPLIDLAGQQAARSAQPNEVVFVDPRVADYRKLVDQTLQARGQAEPAQVEVVVLDVASDGVDQIANWLGQYHDAPLQAVHILSHGGSGVLELGTTVLDGARLDTYADRLARWGAALGADADLLLYGCNVAEGEAGQAFVDRLAQLTGADVAASDDRTGSAALGGDWVLEARTGGIEALALTPGIAGYDHLLSSVTPSKGGDTANAVASLGAQAAFRAAANLGTQLDVSSELGYALPIADLPFSGLIRTADGRTLGDVLSFRTTAGSTVLDDYLASTASPTMGGLMDRLGDYLNGRGVYSHLESLVDNAAGSPSIAFSASGDSFTVNLSLSRSFLQPFGFGEKLKPLGFDFQSGQGVSLVADIHYGATYDFSIGSVQLNTLDARIHTPSSSFNAGVVLGVLDAQASGTLSFDTGTIAFAATAALVEQGSVFGGFPFNYQQVKSPFASDYQSGDNRISRAGSQPSAFAKAEFDIGGAIGGTALSAIAGGTPHISLSFGGLTVNETTVNRTTPVLSGTATVLSGQQLLVSVSNGSNTVTYAATPDSNGNWSVDMATATAQSGSLTLVNGQTYTVTAQIKRGSQVSASASVNLVVATGGLQAQSISAHTLTPTLGGAATLLPGQTFRVTLTDQADPAQTATYAPTPSGGTWALDLASAVPVSGSLALVNGHSYSIQAQIMEGAQAWSAATATLLVNTALGSTTVTGTVNGSASALARLTGTQSGSVPWASIQPAPLTLSTSHFSGLQAFTSLDATELVGMLRDLGSYLELLRDSGRFDALLPFTDVKLGSALDFSAAMRQVLDEQLTVTLLSGLTGSAAVSPVLSGDTAFDLYIQRPADKRPSVLTITVAAAETAGFKHINQLAALLGQKIATAANGLLGWDGSLFEISETLKGGLAIDASTHTDEEQTLRIHAAAGSYALKLGSGGSATGAISVLASPIEVQQALEAVLGVGNVVVTGRAKYYQVQFTGALAGTDQAALQAVPASDVVAGGVIDVTASELSRGSDGRMWGKLNLSQAVPGEFSVLRVAGASGLSIQQLSAGSDSTEAVQRLFIVHGGAGTFTLKGTDAAGVAFSTSALAWNASTADIANALHAALPGVTGLSVADVSPDYAADNLTRVFDIAFGKKNATDFGAYAAMSVETSGWASGVPAQALVVTQQTVAAAVGATPAASEVQRLSISNANGGSFSLGATLDSLFYQSATLAYGSSAAAIQTALVDMLKLWRPTLGSADVTVSAVAGKSNTWDIAFTGALAATDMPQLRVNSLALTSPAGGTYGSMSRLGFAVAGQEFQIAGVTRFATLNELMARFQQAISASALSVSPAYDAATRSLVFQVRLALPQSTEAIAIHLGEQVGELSSLTVDSTLDFTSSTAFETRIGFDFQNLNTFALRAAGAYGATLTANASDTSPVKWSAGFLGAFPSGTSSFSLVFDGESYDLTLDSAATSSNTTRADLVADIQGVLGARAVLSGGVLDRLGFHNLGEAVAVGLSSGNQLQLSFGVPVSNARLIIADPTDALQSVFGFRTSTVYPSAKAVKLATNGQLSAAAHFQLKVDQSDAVAVTVPADAGNASTADLVADINAALNATPVSGHAYLGSGGLGFTSLGQAVQAILNNGQIELVTQSARLASLQILVSGRDTATTELGFTPGQFATTNGAYVFLQDASVAASYSAQVHGQNGSTPASLASAGQATLGMLDLSFTGLRADYGGSMAFSLRNGLAGAPHDRIRLNALYDSAASQTALLGLGSDLSTSGTVSATAAPFQSNGQLLRDVGLSVTVGTTVLDVVVTQAAASDNTSIDDLAADVDAAIHAALVSQQGADPYVAHSFVGVTDIGTVASPLRVLSFTAPTTTLTLADHAAQIYDASTGRLATDLRLSVAVAGLASPVDVLVRSADTSANKSLADLLTSVSDAIDLALAAARSNTTDAAAQAGIDALIAATDLVGQSGGALTLKTGVVTAKTITLKNLAVAGRLLEGDFITTPVYRDAAGTPGSAPLASLQFSGLGVLTPAGISAQGLVPSTAITISVSNTAALFAGAEAEAAVTVVPSNGLGVLTPLKDIAWSDIKADLGQLGSLIGDLGKLGAFGELGRALPLLGTSVSDLFDFTARFAAIDSTLAGQGAVGLNGLQAALASAFGVDATAIALSLDGTGGSEALRVTLPYRVLIDSAVSLELIFNDEALLSLFSPTQQAMLAGLVGSITRLKDSAGAAKLQLHADLTFNLDFGIDLSNTAKKGQVFLFDRIDAGAAGLAGDTGTFARLDALTATGTGLDFESSQGIYRLGIASGSATVSVAGGSGFALQSDASDGAADGRLYLRSYGQLDTAAAGALKAASFGVFFDGSASATLPMTLKVSDQLGQLAMEQIDGFINPLPLGKMEIAYRNLGDSFAKMGGKGGVTLLDGQEAIDSHAVISSQIAQAVLPARPVIPSGSGAATPEGAPVDNDNEGALATTNPDPYVSSTEGAGASTTPSGVTVGSGNLFGTGGATNPSADGYDISLVLPDFEYWQLQLGQVLKSAVGESCDPDKPINGPLIFLLRDPTIIVNTVDKVLESIQKGLDAFSSVLDLPIIGDQLQEATQFVASLRGNVVDAIKTALANAVDVYGGLDNALRMSLFDMLTTDTNGDYVIQASELNSNVFLNFLRDYNGDHLITPDDIVVEYLAGFSQPELDPALGEYLGVSDGNPLPAVIAGQRTAWVTSGINVVQRDADGNIVYHDDGTPCYVGEAGQVVLDQSLQNIVDDIADAIDSVNATAADLFTLFSGIAEQPSFFNSLSRIVTFIADKAADGYDYQHLLTDVFGAGVSAAVLTDVADGFRPSTGALAADAAVLRANLVNGTTYVPKAVLSEFKQAIKDQAAEVAAQVAINQSTAIQFRMNLGQTYTPSLDLSFDVGVPGLNLGLDGGIGLKLNWDLYLGFGVDVTDGFYVITNMPGNAGIGQVTTYSSDPALKGVATGIADNARDAYIDNLWLVGKPGQTAAVKELQATVDVYLAPGAGNTPAQLNAQLFFLNGTMTDNWDGWIKDNDTGIWGSGSDSMGRLSGTQNANYGRTTSMFDGDSGADGSRTRLQLHFGVDLKDVGLFGIPALSAFTNGRLTFTDLSNAKLADLIKVDWDARAQVNLHMELGVSLGGEGYLPSIVGDFHMTWMANSKNQYVQQIDQFFASGYDKLFKVGAPSIWFSDVYLDAGTFFTRFLNPIAKVIQDVTDPIMPVIDALTTPIPGISSLMGRDYSIVDLASDMSALFGGVSKVDFIIAMVRLLDVIDGLPTNTARMLIPVAQSLIVSGTRDRKLNLAALPALPGIPNIDVPVDLPYLNLADVAVKDGSLEFSLSAGVGWKQDTSLLEIFKGNLPPLSFDFALNADVKVPAPYIDVTPVNFTVPGVLDRSGNLAQFTLNIKAGWPDLRLSDILSGNFAPRFDVTVVMPDIDLTPNLLPQLKLLLPKMSWSIGSKTWEWAAGGEVEVRWPDAVQSFVSASTIKTIDLTGASFDVVLPTIAAFLPTVQVKWPTVHWVGLGKEFTWEQTAHTDLGWSSLISDAGLLAALVDPSRTVVVEMPDVWLPSVNLADLLPSIDWSISLPGLPSLPSINIGLPAIDVPGQQTVGPMDALNSFKDKLKKPGNALTFPILDDPLTAVINMLTGKPADLMLFRPQNLEVKVGFRVSYPIYPPLYVGIGGEIKLSASLALGFDTYGISKFFDSHNVVDIFDGFYVSDNIVNGVDLPEVRLDAKLAAFAELNAFIVRGGVEGGIRMTGTLDIYDEDRDNKYRASELIAAVSEDPLDVVSMSLRGSAYIAAYVDIFLLFDWERVWEWTFMDVTLFTWEHDPASKKPILGTMAGSTLSLNAGSGVGSIDGQEAVTNTSADRKRRSTDDGNESYTLTGSGGTVNVSATLTNGQTYTKTFVGVSKVKAFGGAGDDRFDASGLDRPVLFIAGGGNDILIGGSADDVLIGSDSGTATLTGNGGNDLLIARGGTTTMIGGAGDDTYRVLGNWGQASISDSSGANVVDFSRQTAAVTVDDAEFKALRGSNTLQWTAATTLDEVRGGAGGDIIDLSGNVANLLVSITGTNAGWVKGSASGMTQASFASSTAQAMKDAGDNAGRGFRFTGFENVVGGQGSDVFRVRDGASLTGSLSGDTAAGRHHDAGGNELANARNTLDFSEYTRAVQVNEEGNSAFGSAGASNIQVRGFHNIFGGQGGDWLVGDGRNNLLVGNDGTDTLEGQAAHDLLVADTFVAYTNLLAGQTRPLDSSLKNVSDYLSLQAVGAAEFGAAARNWIWKGQTLENRSLTTAGAQVLKGGSGNDVILGALGGDIINIGGSGEGNDTILADLGRVQIDFLYRSALSATSFGNRGGGNDTIYLGSGSNLLIAGNGKDTIYGADAAGSFNVVLTDNGTVQYKTAEASVAGQTKLTFAVSGSYTHMLDYVEAPVAETGGSGNDDTLRMGSGSAIVFGGAGQDSIAFNAASSTGANTRFIAGDHARIDTDANGSVTAFASSDTAATSGGNDTISVGSPADLIARHLGTNYLIGGMGSDTLLVSAAYDAATGATTQGAARSVDVILADNGSITRPDGDARLARVLSTQITAGLGGDDRVLTANGDKTIIGGVGNDTVQVGTTSASTRLIAGDNADISYASPGSFTSFSTLDTVQTTGGVDAIQIGSDASTGDLGANYILGGMEADTVQVAASWNAATSSASFGSATTTDVILSDNGMITRPDGSTLLSHVYSTQITAGLGGDDRVLTANGDKTIIGGVGNDLVQVGTTSASTRLIAGDNADITYASPGSFTSFSTLDTAQTTGGVDAIQIGSDASTGDLGSNYIFGGMEADTVQVAASWNAATSSASFGSATTTDVILSDNGVITRPDGSTLLSHVYSTQITAGLGGGDRVLTANGDKTIIGGVGNDTITVGTSSTSTRLIAGDNADISYASPGSFTSFSTLDTLQTTGGVDAISVGTAASTGDLGSNYIFGGMDADTVHVAASWDAGTSTASFGSATSTDVILSDNGVITRPDGSTLLSHVYSTQITAGLGGDDRVLTANGDKTIIGGVGNDLVQVGTTSASTRLIAGDNAEITYDGLGGFLVFQTSDLIAATGGQDVIRIGDAASTGDLGFNFVFGGMGADQVWISAEYDTVAKTDRIGKAVSEDIVIGDNGRIERAAGSAGTPNLLLQVVTTHNDKGGDDRILTANGGKVLIGGFGADIIHARDGDNLVMGDNAQIDYDTVSRNGVLRAVLATDIVIGGNDTITLEEGFKLVSGGFGADTIQIDADNIGNVSGAAATSDAIGAAVWALGSLVRVTSVVGVAGTLPTGSLSGAALAAAQTGNRGRNGRFIAGDNVRFEFDDQSGLTAMGTIDPIAATGGADNITLGAQGIAATADLGYQVVMGGMAADTITVRDQTASTDLILGDNGDLLRRARGYATLSVTSSVPESGGADTIVSGRGDKLVIGGFGADTITLRTTDLPDAGGNATATNRSIVLGDSGVVAFDASGGGALQRVESTSLSLGGDDIVSIGDGDVSFIGGYGRDTLAVGSNRSAFRIAAGDNARFSYAGIGNTAWQAEDLISAQTLDQTSATGDADTLRFGVSGSLTGVMGQAILLGGIGADRLTVTGQSADALLIGDNGQVTIVQGTPASGPNLAQVSMRWANGQNSPANTSYLEGVATLSPDLGGADILETTSGTAVLIGGQGGDSIRGGRGNGVVFGDGAALTWSSGVLRQATSFGVAQGGADTIELGAGSGADDGHKLVVGGFGGDSITVSSVQGGGNTPETARERAIAGDNATIILDANGRLTGFSTLDTDAATGGNDTVQLSVAAASPAVAGLTDINVVAGGVGGDSLTVGAANRYVGVASGDNLDYRRSDGSATDPGARYRSLFATVLQPFTGGDDTLRLGSGDLLAFGGAGSDRIEASTAAGDSATIFGDAGTAAFDIGASGRLEQLNTLADASGGNDSISVGAGTLHLFGGAGNDTLSASAAGNATRVVLGDTGQVNFVAGQPGLIQTSADDAPAASSADTITVPLTDGSGTLGHNFVIGGAGQDTLIGSISDDDRVLPGSGMLDAAANGGKGVVVSITVLGNHGEFGYGTTLGDSVDGIVVVSPAGSDGGGGTGGTGGTGGSGGPVTEYKLTGSGSVLDGTTQAVAGRIAYPSLTSGLATFAPMLSDGRFGSLTLSQDGSWSYTLAGANSLADRLAQVDALQALAGGEVAQEVFALTTTDGSSTTVTITVTGSPLVVFDHRGLAQEAGGRLNASVGFDAWAPAGNGGLLDDAIGTVSNGSAIARITGVGNGLVAGTVGTALAGRFGSLIIQADGSYLYRVDDSAAATEHLARGEVGVDSFTYTVTRDGGRSVSASLDIDVIGADDTPQFGGDLDASLIEPQAATGTLERHGSIHFSDFDLADTHQLTGAFPLGSNLGQLVASLTAATSPIDGSGGAIAWTYTVDAAAVEHLSAGETRVESFAIMLDNGRGQSSSTVVTVTLTGTNDAPLIDVTGVEGSITELAVPVGELVTGGSVAFSDVDGFDSHRLLPAVSAPAGALGTLSARITADTQLPDGQGGEIAWEYRVPASALESLGAGETRVETFTLSLDDGQGGVSTRDIRITLIGTNDAPVLAGGATGSVTEAATPAGALTDGGRIGFTDIDLGDSHTILSVGALDVASLGSVTARLDGNAIVWTYSVPSALLESLSADETRTERFVVELADRQGDVGTSIIVVDIRGTNDAPVPVADKATAREDITLEVPAGGVLANDRDVDTLDLLHVEAVGVAGSMPSVAAVGADLTGTYGTLTLNPDGGYTYRVDTAAGQALRAGETATEVFTYVVVDGHGGSASSTLTLEIVGSDDQPAVSGDTRGAVKTDRNLVATGKLTATDADAGESGFVASAQEGLYGRLVIDTSGRWAYTADPARVVSGLFAIDTIAVSTLDGSAVDVRITVNGPDAILIAALSPTLSGQVLGSATPLFGAGASEAAGGLEPSPQAAGLAPVPLQAASLPGEGGALPAASGAPGGSADGGTAQPASGSQIAVAGSRSSGTAQPAGVLGDAPRPDGATLGGLVPPVVQQAPVVIPQTVGSQVFSPPSPPIGMLAFGLNIRLANSPQSVPGELDRQSGGNGLQQEREAPTGSDGAPAAPQPAEPSAGVLPVERLGLPADAPEPAPADAPVPGEALATAPAEATENSGSATGNALAAAAGVVAGAGRIQWTLPAADKAANRRASGRRAA